MSSLIFSDNKKRMSSAANFQGALNVKYINKEQDKIFAPTFIQNTKKKKENWCHIKI